MVSAVTAIVGGVLGLLGSTAIANVILFIFRPAILYNFYIRYLMFSLGLRVNYLKAGDFTFCYAERGKGKSSKPTMLFLHGFSGAKDMWARVIKALPTDVHVIILDMPGHGKTSRDMKADYTFVGQAKNIHHFVQAYGLDKSPFHILGISMGGGVAGVYAALYPQDLVKVSLFCPAAILSPTVSKYGQEMVKDETVPLPVTAQEIKNTQPYIVYNGREMPNWVYRIIAELRRPHNEFYRHVLQEMNKEDSKTALQARLCDIKTPTQVVWGEFDWLLDISSLDIIKEKLKSLDRIDVLDRCGHSIAMERPYKSAKVIMEFVNS
ncbi:monoacylglycerol lipase ABHD6-like isoform X1 [Ptychodera flava]|uniref:monoacylglycerol lipase ABHD6-like isoform X1 n=1 Tax=Ptychodera flava TaxID=63121 RepID=UPI00396A4203